MGLRTRRPRPGGRKLRAVQFDDEEFRRAGARAVDLAARVLAEQAADPVLPARTGEEVRAQLAGPLPRAGCSLDEVLDDVATRLLPHDRRNGHPRFFGYVCASADPVGALADLIASASNQNVTAWRSAPGAVELERLVLAWLDEMVGFGGGGGGLLVSGGSMGNAVGLACALGRRPDRERQCVYLSTEAHLSVRKAARLYGVRPEHVRTVGVDRRRRMRPGELASLVEVDRARGRVPACVVATAGTASTGAIDPLEEIADLAAAAGLWLHVDGAYGAPAALLGTHGFLREGFARADSLSLDPHKWLFAPLDVGCVLVRDLRRARECFAEDEAYTRVEEQGERERFAFFDLGPELSRRARALKLWMILRVRGADAIAAVLRRNVALRRHLDRRVAADPALEALGSGLSISCFRYRPAGVGEQDLDAINRGLLEELVASGRFLLSPTEVGGCYALRVCIVNFRTRREDVDALVDEVRRLGHARGT